MPVFCAVGSSNKTEDCFTLLNIPHGIQNGACCEVWLLNISREDFRAMSLTGDLLAFVEMLRKVRLTNAFYALVRHTEAFI